MRKFLLIGVIVCVLAVGGIGAAFANNLGFGSSVGALASGTKYLPNVGVDGVTWVLESDHPASAHWVKLSFNQDLGSDVGIGVDVLDSGGNVLRHKWVEIAGTIAEADLTSIKWDGGAVPVTDIYGIRVVVSVETP